jgi:hypothetical protein
MMHNPEKTIGDLIDKQGVSFIASVDADGFPNMKAMLSPRKREGIHTLWFTTNTSFMRAAQFRENPKASVYFYDKRFFRGVMLVGTMEVLEDAASIVMEMFIVYMNTFRFRVHKSWSIMTIARVINGFIDPVTSAYKPEWGFDCVQFIATWRIK